MMRPFAHPVTCCCVLLGVVAQSTFEIGQTLSYLQMKQQLLVMLGVVGQQCCVRSHGALISLILVTSSLLLSMVVVKRYECKYVAVCSKIIENG